MTLAPRLVFASLLVAAATVAHAGEWQHLIAPYGWGPSLDANVIIRGESSDSEADFADILENVEFAGLIRYEGHGEQWGVLLDGVFLGLGYPVERNGSEVDIDTTMLELAGSYHANEHVEVLFGARWVDLSADVHFDVLPDLGQSKSWLDGFAGFRVKAPMGEKWRWVLRGDIGAGGSDFTWNAETAVIWDATEHFALALGWRVLSMDYEEGEGADQLQFDAILSGPEVGFGFRF